MPKLSKKTQEMRNYQAEQDNIAAARINEVLCFFHAEVLHCFVALTMVRTPSHLFYSRSTPRAAKLTGFCPATARKKRVLFESGKLQEIFSRKQGSGRKSKCAAKQDEIIDDLESHD